LLLVLFWPVGLYLLYKKTATDKSVPFTGIRPVLITGWVLLGFGIISVFAYLDERMYSALPFSALFIIGGVLLLRKVRDLKSDKQRYSKYINVVTYEQLVSIEAIANSIGEPSPVTEQNLREMIDKGYFQAHINQASRELIFAPESPLAAQKANITYRVVQCPHCHAAARIPVGDTARCEYCCSWLQG
jgi:hypothetical protein